MQPAQERLLVLLVAAHDGGSESGESADPTQNGDGADEPIDVGVASHQPDQCCDASDAERKQGQPQLLIHVAQVTPRAPFVVPRIELNRARWLMADRSVVYRLRAEVGQFSAQMAQAGASTKKFGDDLVGLDAKGEKMRRGLDELAGTSGRIGLVLGGHSRRRW